MRGVLYLSRSGSERTAVAVTTAVAVATAIAEGEAAAGLWGRCGIWRVSGITGGRGNPFSAIGVNAKSATNLRSRFAMHGAEIHGNSGRDDPTRILSIIYCTNHIIYYMFSLEIRRRSRLFSFKARFSILYFTCSSSMFCRWSDPYNILTYVLLCFVHSLYSPCVV